MYYTITPHLKKGHVIRFKIICSLVIYVFYNMFNYLKENAYHDT